MATTPTRQSLKKQPTLNDGNSEHHILTGVKQVSPDQFCPRHKNQMFCINQIKDNGIVIPLCVECQDEELTHNKKYVAHPQAKLMKLADQEIRDNAIVDREFTDLLKGYEDISKKLRAYLDYFTNYAPKDMREQQLIFQKQFKQMDAVNQAITNQSTNGNYKQLLTQWSRYFNFSTKDKNQPLKLKPLPELSDPCKRAIEKKEISKVLVQIMNSNFCFLNMALPNTEYDEYKWVQTYDEIIKEQTQYQIQIAIDKTRQQIIDETVLQQQANFEKQLQDLQRQQEMTNNDFQMQIKKEQLQSQEIIQQLQKNKIPSIKSLSQCGALTSFNILGYDVSMHQCYRTCRQVDMVTGNNPYADAGNLCGLGQHAGVAGTFFVVAIPKLNKFLSTKEGEIRSRGSDIPGAGVLIIDDLIIFKKCGNVGNTGYFCRGLKNGCKNITGGKSTWGINPYTYDSNLCKAGLHAGLLDVENGGFMVKEQLGKLREYQGNQQNGVTTKPFERYTGVMLY